MKKIIYLPLIISCMATVGCSNDGKKAAKSSYDITFIDNSVAPGADFYDYSTGGWQKNNPLKDEFARFGSFDQLRENNKERLRALVEEIAAKPHSQGTIEQKIADLYNTALDTARLNAEGPAPLMPYIEEIMAVTSKDELAALMGKMTKTGISPFFYSYIDADASDSNMNLYQIYQGGLSMGERDYYLEDEESMKNIRAEYLKFIEKLYVLIGRSQDDASALAGKILAIETKLAEASSTTTELRDPVANFNKMPISDFIKMCPDINIANYLKSSGLDINKEVSVGQPKFIAGVNSLFNETSLDDLKEFFIYKTTDHVMDFLSEDFVTANFDFYEKVMSGKLEQQPRWKKALSMVDGSLGEAVGQMYVAKYFPAEAKERMVTLVANLQNSLRERITNLEWMSDETKAQAQEKLSTFSVKIGYPDKWRDYSALNISKEDSYLANYFRSVAFEWDYNLAKSNMPVDKSEWFMSPQTVNAYYNPLSNEICFPAGILQEPFFYLDGDDAVNYGAIGVVIGHEMTHGFDDQGRMFDKEGNIRDWWSVADADKFNSLANVLVEQFNGIEILPSVFANGTFTLGENIADQGGVLISYQALQNAS